MVDLVVMVDMVVMVNQKMVFLFDGHSLLTIIFVLTIIILTGILLSKKN